MSTPESLPRASASAASESADDGAVECWCCGEQRMEKEVVHLGSRPEVAVCLRCAHFLHHQARAREDELRPSLQGRGRDVLRAGRGMVMRHGWQHAPGIGPVFRWLGRRLP